MSPAPYSFPLSGTLHRIKVDPTRRPALADWTTHQNPVALPILHYGGAHYPQGELGQVLAIREGIAYVLWTPGGIVFNAPAFRRELPLSELYHATPEWNR